MKLLALAAVLAGPVRDEWFGSPSFDAAVFVPHSEFGFVCPVLRPGLDTP